MDLDPTIVTAAGALAGLLLVEMRLLRRELKLVIAAGIERSRRRNRRDSDEQQPQRRDRDGVVEAWGDEDTTDMHELIELERKRERVRRQTERQRLFRGDRPPRPGTHSDKPYKGDR